METNNLRLSLGSPKANTFKSIFDSSPTEDDLWKICTKKFSHTALGPVIHSSKLFKTSKGFAKLTLSRFYFLHENYLTYGTTTNSLKAKKYINLEGVKLQASQENFSLRFLKSEKSFELFANNIEIFNEWKRHLGKFCIMQDFEKYYKTLELIGSGGDGQVFLAEQLRTGTKYAVKVFEKAKVPSRFRNYQALIDEIQILRSHNHENIVKFHEVYENETHLHLIMEHLPDGDLEAHLDKKNEYDEKDALLILNNTLRALAPLHNKGILHRDLKPANIMLSPSASPMGRNTDIKLIDFGQATRNESHRKECGTLGYMAPELLTSTSAGALTSKVDVFSAGAVFYELLAGRKLFDGCSFGELSRLNKVCRVDYNVLSQKKISQETLDLLKKMLEWNPDDRITVQEALEHAVFRKDPRMLMTMKTADESEMLANSTI